MTDSDALRREFMTFATYLGATGDLSAVASSYVVMHDSALVLAPTAWDEGLARFARRGVTAVALADAYARLTTPRGLLRRKLVLVLALLESAAPTHAQFDSARPTSRSTALAALSGMMVLWVIRSAAAVALLGPAHALTSIASRRG